MNLPKIIVVALFTTAVLGSSAATASATTLTSPTGTVYTATIKLENEGPIKIGGSFSEVECKKSTIEETVQQHGAGITVAAKATSVTVTECNFPTTVKTLGTIEIHPALTGSEVDGKVTSTGIGISVHTSAGECTFTTSNTPVGTLTGTQATKGAATLDIVSATIPRTSGNFLCGSFGTLNGSYKSLSPGNSWIDS